MAVLRSEIRNKFSIIPNEVIRDKTLSHSEYRLLIYLYSLPDDWKIDQGYLGKELGCTRININQKISKIKKQGYLEIEKVEKDKKEDVDYVYILKIPSVSKTDVSKTDVSKTDVSKTDTHTNTNRTNTNRTNTDLNTVVSPKALHTQKFKKPSIAEIEKYIEEKGYTFNAEDFYNFYESKNWMIGKNKMSKWRSACATWNSKEKQSTKRQKYEKKLPNWFGEKIESEELTEEEEKEMKKMLEEVTK